MNVNQRQEEQETGECNSNSSVDDAKHEENNEPENIIQERRRNKYAAAAALEALELAYFEISKYSNSKVSSSSKQKDEVVISKGNNNVIDLKQDLEGKEIQKQSAREEESHPRDDVITPAGNKELVSMLGELSLANDDHKSQCDATTANEELREERAHPSSQAGIRWNPERTQNVRKPVMEGTTAQKRIHTHHDWKMMSVRTR